MAKVESGVFPCYENQFAVGKAGTESATTNIANCEEFSVAFDNGVEEWTAFENEGWKSRLMTAKSITISVKGKRTIGDAGNDQIAALSFENGRKVEAPFMWTFPTAQPPSLKMQLYPLHQTVQAQVRVLLRLNLKLCQTANPYIQQPLKKTKGMNNYVKVN